MKDITPILKALGLLDSEIKTYLTALKNGPSTVIELTKTTRLSRQAVYVAIENLTERSLMTSVMRGKKRYYAAEHPDKLLAYAQRKSNEMGEYIADLKRSLPALELQIGGERPVVRMYEGKEGIRAALDNVRIDRPKELYEIADTEAVNKLLTQDDLKALKTEFKKIGTKAYGIYHYPSRKPENEVDGFVYLPNEEEGFNADIMIHGDQIMMASLEGKLYSVILKSKPLATAMKRLIKLAIKK